jgi:hypothetical protein
MYITVLWELSITFMHLTLLGLQPPNFGADTMCRSAYFFGLTLRILVNDQLDAQFFFLIFYFNPLHVSSNLVLIIRKINCINTTSSICHSLQVTV